MRPNKRKMLLWLPAPAGCALVVLFFGGARLLAPPQVQVSEMMLGNLPAVGSFTRDLFVRNSDWIRSVEVVHCESSCGCTVPTLSRLTVPPLSSVALPIKIEPRPWEAQLSSRIAVDLADGRRFIVSVQAGLVQPFETGPDRAAVRRDSDEYVIPFNPIYDHLIAGGFVVIPGRNAPAAVTVDAANHCLRIKEPGILIPMDSTAELTLRFEPLGELPDWSGWLISAKTQDGAVAHSVQKEHK